MIVQLRRWDHDQEKDFVVTVELEDVIRNPGSFRMDDIGVALLNQERRKLSLNEFKYNPETGTFDET